MRARKRQATAIRAATWGAACALLVAVGLPAAAAAGPADGPAVEIRDPLLAFLLELSEGDSLGVWSGGQVRARVQACGRPSRLPLQDLVQVARARPEAGTAAAWPGAELKARWTITLREDLQVPMPYSILGYHPGSLTISRELAFSELALGSQTVRYRDDDKDQVAEFAQVRLFPLTSGRLVLDADRWVDSLLGGALDDSWSLGFAVAREQARRLGVAVSLGREGKRIFGEFDFAQDKIVADGRPVAAALSGYSRRWLDPALGNLPQPWR